MAIAIYHCKATTQKSLDHYQVVTDEVRKLLDKFMHLTYLEAVEHLDFEAAFASRGLQYADFTHIGSSYRRWDFERVNAPAGGKAEIVEIHEGDTELTALPTEYVQEEYLYYEEVAQMGGTVDKDAFYKLFPSDSFMFHDEERLFKLYDIVGPVSREHFRENLIDKWDKARSFIHLSY